MAVAVKCTGVDETRKNRRRSFALTLSGSYVTSGDTVNFTTLNKNGFSRAIPPSNPLFNQDSVEINAVPNGYEAYLVQNGSSPTLSNFLLKISTTANTELAAGAYPGALTGLPIEITVTTPKYSG